MEMQKLVVREQIVKKVVKSGNGGAVWVPKSWLGQEVVVILPEKQKLGIREKIVHLLEPYLKYIVAAGIYGSYARNEQTDESDIDLLVITKDKNLRLDFKEEKIEITSFPIDKFRMAIERHPAVYYQAVQEIEPLVNGYVFEELRNIKIANASFRGYLKETREHIKSNREFLELDRMDGAYLKSYSALYSSILRLRGLFVIRCILDKSSFSNKNFRNWLVGSGLSSNEFAESYKAYCLVSGGEKASMLKIRIDVAEKVLNILERELSLLEARVNGK